MRIAWPWLCLGAAVTAGILFPRDETIDEGGSQAAPGSASPKVLSAIPASDGSVARFRREAADNDDFHHLRPIAESLPKSRILALLRSVPEDSSAHDVLIYLWAEQDPHAALDQTLTIDWDGDYQTAKLAAFTIANWARLDPDAAESWLTNTFGNSAKIEKSSPGLALRSELVGSLSRHHPERALDWIRRYKVRHLGGMIRGKLAFDDVAHWRELMEIASEHYIWAESFHESDPAGYAEWLGEIREEASPGSHRQVDQNDIARRLNEALNPKTEADRIWAERSDRNSEFASEILRELLLFAPEDAEQWLRDAAPEISGDLDFVKRDLIESISAQSPSTAFAWLLTIGGKKLQLHLGERVFDHWSQFQPDTAEQAFRDAGFTREWIEQRYE